MADLNSWIAQIAAGVDALGPDNALEIDQSSAPATARTLALAGFPGVIPLWTAGSAVAGLLADPRLAPQHWAAVLLDEGYGVTLASDARSLLPQFLVQNALSDRPGGGRDLAERWDEVAAAALALHAALGGEQSSLDAVIAVAGDRDRRKALLFHPDRRPEFAAAHSKLCRSIDRSASFVRYADWLDAAIAGERNPIEDPARYGAWGRRVLCFAQRRAFADPSMPKPGTALLHWLVEGNAGIDSGLPERPKWGVRPGAASSEAALTEAALIISHVPPATDPVDVALAAALVAEGTRYRGLAHAEAVVALDERGEPERAWDVLQSAAWWAARNTGKVPDAMIEGARFLAERHGWADILWMVERAT